MTTYHSDHTVLDGIYGRLLEMTRPVLVTVLWLTGVAIAGACLLTLCLIVATLVGA